MKLRLVAITAASPATMLENAPASFLNLFPDHLVERKLGLFAETPVRAGDFAGLAGHTGIKEAFAAGNAQRHYGQDAEETNLFDRAKAGAWRGGILRGAGVLACRLTGRSARSFRIRQAQRTGAGLPRPSDRINKAHTSSGPSVVSPAPTRDLTKPAQA